MASSSVSQESLDMDDFDISARRNRIRVHRGHGRGSMPHRGLPDRGDGGDQDRDRGDHNGDMGDGGSGLGLSSHSHLPGDHESPTRGAAARLKDKRCRPNHMKGKLPKDKRKLREKRRSTGVVHLPSTESTGDSLDDEDDDEDVPHDATKRNTMYNEGTASGHHHQTSYEGRHSSNPAYSHPRRNKSPSDLEADLEDNQDYDSTVSHSETNLTLIGRSESSEISQNLPGRQLTGSAGSGGGGTSSTSGSRFGGSGGYNTRYSPESSRALKYNASNISSDADSSRTNTPSTSSSSSVLSRYREAESPRSMASTNNNGDSKEPDSPRRLSAPNSTTNTAATDSNPSSQPIQPRPVGFSVFRDRDSNNSATGFRGEKPAYSSYVSSASRFKDRDGSGSSNLGGVGAFHSRISNYQSPRSFNSASSGTPAVNPQQTETITQLEKQLEKEKQENKSLQQQLEEKDKKIAELEKQIELLNNECDGLDEDNLKLQEENKALIRAMSKLTSNV